MGSDMIWNTWDYRKELERLAAKMHEQTAELHNLRAAVRAADAMMRAAVSDNYRWSECAEG